MRYPTNIMLLSAGPVAGLCLYERVFAERDPTLAQASRCGTRASRGGRQALRHPGASETTRRATTLEMVGP